MSESQIDLFDSQFQRPNRRRPRSPTDDEDDHYDPLGRTQSIRRIEEENQPTPLGPYPKNYYYNNMSQRYGSQPYGRRNYGMMRKRSYGRPKGMSVQEYGMQFVPRTDATRARYGLSWREAMADQKAARQTDHYYGYGGFWKKFGNKALGAGKWLGKNFGQQIAREGTRRLGSKHPMLAAAGNAVIDRAYGEGDYGVGVQSNDIVEDTEAEASVPLSLDNSGGSVDESGDVVIVRREFITNVIAQGQIGRASGFRNESYPINPGLTQSFPFVSQLAQNFTLYKIMGLIYQFVPMSGESGGNSGNQLGKVILATDYDPTATPFINSNQMENYQYSQSAKPSLGQRHGVECAKFHTTTDLSYIRTAPVERSELRWTDQGLFQIASEGVPIPGVYNPAVIQNSSVILGELWVSYTIKLSRASLYGSLLGFNINRQRILSYVSPSAVSSPNSQALTNANPTPQYNNIGATAAYYINGNTALAPNCVTITFPSTTILGTYKITLKTLYGGTTAAIPSASPKGVYYYPTPPANAIPGNATNALIGPVNNALGRFFATQWGSVYYQGISIANATYNFAGTVMNIETYPGLDLQTGESQWDLGTAYQVPQAPGPIITTFPPTAIQSRCNAQCNLNADTPLAAGQQISSETTCFFQVNAPALNVPQVTFYVGDNVGNPATTYGVQSNGCPYMIDVIIEQINGQTSAPPTA